jgi:dihydropyrimidinase
MQMHRLWCHAPNRFDETGKLPKDDKTSFKEMENSVPGLEVRLPLLFSAGVGRGRASRSMNSSR